MKTHINNAPALLSDDQCPACGSKGALVAFRDETWTARLDDLVRNDQSPRTKIPANPTH